MHRSLIVLALICVQARAQDVAGLFIVQDFTKENIFTNNIEGPAFDENWQSIRG